MTDSDPAQQPVGAEAVLAQLHQTPPLRHALGGFGPLVVGAVLLVLMILLAPSVAPERDVERLVDDPEAGVVDQ